jgi:hypothetical protein
MKYHCCSAILVAAILAATATTSLPRRSRRPCPAAPAAQPAQASRAPHEYRQPSPRRPMIPVIKRFPVTIQAVSLVFNRETLSYRQNAVGWTGLRLSCPRPNATQLQARRIPIKTVVSGAVHLYQSGGDLGIYGLTKLILCYFLLSGSFVPGGGLFAPHYRQMSW